MSRRRITFARVDRRLRKGVLFLVRTWTQLRPEKLPKIWGIRLFSDPEILIVPDFAYELIWQTRPMFWQSRAHEPILIVLCRSWAVDSTTPLKPWGDLLARHREQYPLHRIVYAANEEHETVAYAQHGIESIWCTHNALIDDTLFRPPDSAEGAAREFDAIYDARLIRFKRHQLALKVPRLALIHFARLIHIEPCWWVGMRYFRLRRATWLNPTKWLVWPRDLPAAEVAAALRRARVGLCLSPIEGAMLASAQYLLTGLPVVSTPSRGGRDLFFDEYNSLIVDPTSDAVAAGVQTLIARRLDPHQIRAKVLARIAPHRQRLMALVADFQAQQGVPLEQRWTAWKSFENPFLGILPD